MLPVILLIPFITALFLLFFRKATFVRMVALTSSIVNFVLTLSIVFSGSGSNYTLNQINSLNQQFSLGTDGISLVMILLTNLLFPIIILVGFKREQKQVQILNALILFIQSALIGVFLAQNGFLFYIFWELTLIPIYFILLLWGGEDRKNITLKFFIYTMTGS